MFVVMATSEVSPLARTGGLGEVVGALASAHRGAGLDVAVVVPGYSAVHAAARVERRPWRLQVTVGGERIDFGVGRTALPDGTPVFTVEHEAFFRRPELYGDHGGEYADNARRFTFFSRAVLALLERLGSPDILHAHDWQTALLPAFLRADIDRYPWLRGTRTVLTLHNLGYQGSFPSSDWSMLDLDAGWYRFDTLEAWGRLNFLKGGISFADAVTTVSPTYAAEIRTPEHGFGLDGALRHRGDDLVGILNGIDPEDWDPQRDPALPAPFSAEDLGGKQTCREALQREMGLHPDPEPLLCGLVARLVSQKGIDLILESWPDLMARPLQLLVLGRGEPRLEEALRFAALGHPGQASVAIGFDEGLARRIEAGADVFLMPSLYEPCGLNQLYSLRYGTLPLARATGGLQDSIIDVGEDPAHGTGFKFGPPDRPSFLHAIDRTLAHRASRDRWRTTVRRAMAADFSWTRSAQRYREVYEAVRQRRPIGPLRGHL